MKKIIVSILSASLMVAIIGCDNSNTSIENTAEKTVATKSATASEVKLSEMKSSTLSQAQKLDDYFSALTQEQRMLGTVAIYKDGKPQYKKAFILQNDEVVESEKVFQYKVGSITKTFTSVLVFQLIEQGKLSLETPLSKYYPNIKNAEKITIKMMLNHHSGIYNYTSHEEFLGYYTSQQQPAKMVERIERYGSVFEPGEKAEYSNSNFLLLGYIMETITGKSFAELVQENIAEPLGLNATYIGGVINPEKQEIYSFIRNDGWQQVPVWSMSAAGAAGNIVSNAEDLNKFFKGLFDGKLISEELLEKMISKENGYGHGIFDRKIQIDNKEITGYWHNGGIENFHSYMLYFPEQKVGVTSLLNGASYDGDKINDTLIKAAFGKEFDIPEFKELKLTAEQLAVYQGDYSSETHPLDIKVFVQNNSLFAQATGQGPFPLTAIEEDKFEFLSAGIEMNFDPDNKQFVIRQASREDIFIEKNSKESRAKVEIDQELLQSYVGLYKADNFPLDIEVTLKGSDLYAQATGQSAFPLTAVNDSEFRFDLAGIVIKFDANQKQLAITQHGNTNIMTKE